MDDARRLIVAFFQSTAEGRQLLASEPHLAHARTGLGETPLHYLAVENQLDAVEALIAQGAEVNTLNNCGGTPLSEASSLGYTELVSYLLSVGATLWIQGQDEPTLINAVQSGNLETVKVLLDAGADVNVRNELDETAVHIAAAKNDFEMVRLLFGAGADLTARRMFDETPLMVAEWLGATLAADELTRSTTRTNVCYSVIDFDVSDLDNDLWSPSEEFRVISNWSGEAALTKHRFRTRLLWSETALYVRFLANQRGSLNASERPDVTKKILGLWERDVCEIFIAPDRDEPRRYFEFEISPTGEWLDLAIDSTSGERVTDWEYASGMETAACIEENRIVMGMKIPWEAFAAKPKAGDVWLGNIFRCVGREPDRGYLAWRPTMTETPNFHVPEAFGEFQFLPANNANVHE